MIFFALTGKNIPNIITLASLLICFSFSRTFAADYYFKDLPTELRSSIQDNYRQKLSSVIENIARNLPQRIDSYSTLNSVFFTDDFLAYHGTIEIALEGINKSELISNMEQLARKRLCTNPQFYFAIQTKIVPKTLYLYQTPNGFNFHTIKIYDCNNFPKLGLKIKTGDTVYP